MTAGELQALDANTTQDLALVQGLADQVRLRGLVTTADNQARFAQQLERAEAVHAAAVEAAVARTGDWQSVQVAGERVRECRAALKAVA